MGTDLSRPDPPGDPFDDTAHQALVPVPAATAGEVVVSVVIPAYNEAANLIGLYTALRHQLAGHGPYEILIVDDGSTDATLKVLKQLSALDPCVRFVALSRNFGHQYALRAGLDHARGACVITMDADLQHPPELIPRLIGKWREGFEVVTTIRHDGPETAFVKRATASAFYRLAGFLSEVPIKPGAADFRLLDRVAVDAIRQLRETEIFLRGVIPWLGFRAAELDYAPNPRAHGQSSYGFKSMLSLALTGITTTSIQPLRFAMLFATAVACLTMLYGAYAVWVFFFTDAVVQGWTSVIIIVSALGALQLLILGIIGEYLGRVLRETRRRPSYIVREQNCTATAGAPGRARHH